MFIRTYTFYTLHVSNAYFPKIYVMLRHALSFTITESRLARTGVLPLIFFFFFSPSTPRRSRFTRFYDPLTCADSYHPSCTRKLLYSGCIYAQVHARQNITETRRRAENRDAALRREVCIHDFACFPAGKLKLDLSCWQRQLVPIAPG